MRFNKQHGFTFIEIVLTLIIVSVVAAIALPRFFTTSAFDQRGFSDELINALRYAQQYAVASHCGVRVQIAPNSYTLFRAVTSATCASNTPGAYFVKLVNPSRRPEAFTATAPKGITMSSHDIIFTAQGSSSTTQTITVGSAQIRVEATTGFIHLL